MVAVLKLRATTHHNLFVKVVCRINCPNLFFTLNPWPSTNSHSSWEGEGVCFWVPICVCVFLCLCVCLRASMHVGLCVLRPLWGSIVIPCCLFLSGRSQQGAWGFSSEHSFHWTARTTQSQTPSPLTKHTHTQRHKENNTLIYLSCVSV